ncbi:MAG: hypothetical protein K1X86_14260 [Ignavibacteria bacterium]|nr:hypothetical protein [Ignavibacteria bacterium]
MKELENIDVKIIGIISEEIESIEGTAFLKIPIKLNQRPPSEWVDIFNKNWRHPSQFTSRHKPSIASLRNDIILLHETTVEEIQEYHKETLIVVVEDTNTEYNNWVNSELARIEKQKKEVEFILDNVKKQQEAAKKIKFD